LRRSGVSSFAHSAKKPEIGRKATQTAVPEFTLVDQNGKSFRFANARGKIVLVTFIFTTCPGCLPAADSEVRYHPTHATGKKIDDYLLLSITTDPARTLPLL